MVKYSDLSDMSYSEVRELEEKGYNASLINYKELWHKYDNIIKDYNNLLDEYKLLAENYNKNLDWINNAKKIIELFKFINIKNINISCPNCNTNYNICIEDINLKDIECLNCKYKYNQYDNIKSVEVIK